MTGTNKLAAALTILLATPLGWADSLKEIYETALQNDPVLRAARATYHAGAENSALGRAALLPQISASGTYSELDMDSTSNGISGDTDSDTTAFSLSLNQAIFDLPAWYKFQQSKTLSESAKAQFAADQQSLIIRVSDAYFNVLRTHDNLETRKAEERAIQRQLEQTRERFEVGLLPITDVHEAQAAYDDAVVNSLESRGALNIAFEQLQVLTGSAHNVLAGLSEKYPAKHPDESDDQWADYSLANNFQLKVVQLGKDAAYENAKAVTMQRAPKITGSISYSDSDSDGLSFGIPLDRQQDGTTVGIAITMPIWLGGSLDASRRQANHRAVASEENYIAATRNTVQAARSLHQAVVTNSARVKARQQSITSAESALEATQAGYEVGTRNIVDVLVAQRTLYQARRNYANARYDYILSMMRLKEVAGQLSPDDIYELNAWLEPQLTISRAAEQ